MHEPVRKVHVAVPDECDEAEHPLLCKYVVTSSGENSLKTHACNQYQEKIFFSKIRIVEFVRKKMR